MVIFIFKAVEGRLIALGPIPRADESRRHEAIDGR